MRLAEVRDLTVATARGMKQRVTRKGPADIPAFVDVFRGDEIIATIAPAAHDRELILRVYAAAAHFFDADAMGCAFESYSTIVDLRMVQELGPEHPDVIAMIEKASTNPITGQPWVPGEMDEVAAQHDGIAKGWITEVISVTAANRAGDVTLTLLPFHYVGRHLVWDEESPMPEGTNAQGYMADVMLQAMRDPSIATKLPYTPTEGTRAERDVWGAQAMRRNLPCSVAVYADATERDRVRVLRASGFQL